MIITLYVPIAATLFEQSFEIDLDIVEEQNEDRFFTKSQIEEIIGNTERELKEEFHK